MGSEVATGTGPNKKIAKKNAAEAMLLQLGYKASTGLQDQLDKVRVKFTVCAFSEYQHDYKCC